MTSSTDTTSADRPARSFRHWAAKALKLWIMRYSQRRTLADLDEYLLNDIGRSRDDVRGECGKPFWRS